MSDHPSDRSPDHPPVSPPLPPRPDPPRRPGDVIAAWVSWIGPARLVASAVSVTIVVAGGYWLLRAPHPPPEASLPVAAAAAPSSTLPPPSPPSTATSIPASQTVVVHVAGAVRRPGVHELGSWARVHTAIDAAGGATAEADLDGLNLAATVVDGQRIYVPISGEVDPVAVPSGVGGLEPASPDGPIDLNRAGVDVLETLPGVGPATAAAIVDDRERNGPFASVDDLDRVPGIGPAKLGALRDLVTA